MRKNILFPSPVQMSQQPAILLLQVEYSLPTQHLQLWHYHQLRPFWSLLHLKFWSWRLDLKRSLPKPKELVAKWLASKNFNLEGWLFGFCCQLLHWGGEQGWRSGESTRLPPMWPGFNSRRRRHMWVEFVVGSLPCSERFFSGYSGFPLSSKTNISKFQFYQESGRWRTTMWMCYLQIVIYFLFGHPAYYCKTFWLGSFLYSNKKCLRKVSHHEYDPAPC